MKLYSLVVQTIIPSLKVFRSYPSECIKVYFFKVSKVGFSAMVWSTFRSFHKPPFFFFFFFFWWEQMEFHPRPAIVPTHPPPPHPHLSPDSKGDVMPFVLYPQEKSFASKILCGRYNLYFLLWERHQLRQPVVRGNEKCTYRPTRTSTVQWQCYLQSCLACVL